MAAVGGLAGLALLLAAPTVAQDPVVRVGISLPLGDASAPVTEPMRDAFLLALTDPPLPGVTIETVVLDHAADGVLRPEQGAADLATLAADPAVVAVFGPLNSSVAEAQIPVGSAAGLPSCSAGATNPGLTKGPVAAALRASGGGANTFVRTVASDDHVALAMALHAYETLGLRSVAIVDDTSVYGAGIGDAFQAAWSALGGTVTGRVGVPAGVADYAPIVRSLADAAPDAFFFGGVTTTGAPALRLGMAAAGVGDLPLLVGEGIVDGPVDLPGSYLALAGAAAAGTVSAMTTREDYPGRASFTAAYRAAYGTDPVGYAAPAYACGEVIRAAIADAAAAGGVDREAVRARVTDPARTWETVLGPIAFDANGDATPAAVTLYAVDPAAGAAGDWVPILVRSLG
ncbi:MAG: branched-chain amino acid ABC transporter substrate-binding protein [Chloroflexota bacterium]